jgi:hypothetical protein
MKSSMTELLRCVQDNRSALDLEKFGLKISQIMMLLADAQTAELIEYDDQAGLRLTALGVERLSTEITATKQRGNWIRPWDEARQPRLDRLAIYLPHRQVIRSLSEDDGRPAGNRQGGESPSD